MKIKPPIVSFLIITVLLLNQAAFAQHTRKELFNTALEDQTTDERGGVKAIGDTILNFFFGPVGQPNYYLNPNNAVDSTTFSQSIINADADLLTPHPTLLAQGFNSFWQKIVEPNGNRYRQAVSWFDPPGQANNRYSFIIGIPLTGATLSWKSRIRDNNFRDGYQVQINGDTLFAVGDNDPSTDGDTVWVQHTVNIDAAIYGGQTVAIIFVHNATNQFIINLDDFVLVEGNIATSVRKNKTDFSIQLYPNPATNDFTFIYNTQSSKNVAVKIYNNLGVLVAEREYDKQVGILKKNIPLSHLPKGVYFVNFISKDNKTVKKLIIN